MELFTNLSGNYLNKLLIEKSNDIIVTIDNEFKILAFNTKFYNEFASEYGREPKLGDNFLEYFEKYPKIQDHLKLLKNSVFNGNTHKGVEEFLTTSGNIKIYDINFFPTSEKDVTTAAFIAHDITLNKKLEEELLKANRLYSFLSQTNQTIVRCTNKQELYDRICKIAVLYGNFVLAWIGEVTDGGTELTPIAEYGDHKNYLDNIKLSTLEIPEGMGPGGRAFREQRIVYTNNIHNDDVLIRFKPEALARGYHSIAALPIIMDGKSIGCLVLYASENDFFTPELNRLLEEISNDISFALQMFKNNEEKESYFNTVVTNEERFKGLFYNAPMGYQSLNKDGKLIDVNQQWLDALGYSREEVIGRWFGDFMMPESAKKVCKNFPRFLEKGEISVEFDMLRKDGTTFIAAYNGKVSNKADGTFNRTHCVFIDITEKRKKEEQLLYQSQLLQNVHDAIFAVDKNLFITSINKAAEELFKTTASKALDKKLTDVVTIKGNKAEYLAQHTYSNRSWSGELEVSINNVNLIVSVSLSVLIDQYGNDIGIVGILHNITEKRYTEEKLRKLSTAIEQSSTSILITDDKGCIEYVNSKFCEITGYSYNELIGGKPSILKSGHTSGDEYIDLWKTIKAGNSWSGEFLNKRKDGSLFWESASIYPIKDNKGNIINFVGIKDDITQRKKMEKDLIEAKEKAETMNKLKSNFLSNMSHELRTPMVGILGFAEILRNEVADPDLREMIKNIIKSGNRLIETFNLILNFSKLEANKEEVNLVEVELAPFIKNHVKLFEDEFNGKELTLELIEKEEKATALLDKRLFKEVLGNIVNNAIKYTDKGGVKIEISKEGSDAVIKIIDSGIGIPEEGRQLIFEEFRQVSEGFNRRYEGTGLGLTITKKLVVLMKGNIGVESKLGEGTTFILKFPLLSEIQNIANYLKEDTVMAKEVVKPVEVATNGKPSILVVEDDPSSRLVINILLRNFCNIDIAVNGDEAIEKAKNKNYSLIIMDINLGKGLSGIEVTGTLRTYEKYMDTPIIALTAYAMPGDKEEFIKAGCSYYLSKPFKNEMLVNIVKEHLKLNP